MERQLHYENQSISLGEGKNNQDKRQATFWICWADEKKDRIIEEKLQIISDQKQIIVELQSKINRLWVLKLTKRSPLCKP